MMYTWYVVCGLVWAIRVFCSCGVVWYGLWTVNVCMVWYGWLLFVLHGIVYGMDDCFLQWSRAAVGIASRGCN